LEDVGARHQVPAVPDTLNNFSTRLLKTYANCTVVLKSIFIFSLFVSSTSLKSNAM
jgi:hypothetical protein